VRAGAAVAENSPQQTVARAAQLLARSATAGAVLVFIVVVASAFLRLAQAAEAWPDAIVVVRFAHRIAAVGVGFLVLVIAVACWSVRRRQPGEAVAAVGLVALTIFLSVLGRATPGSELPAVTLGNLLGGMAMMGLLWWLRLGARETWLPAVVAGPGASAFGWMGVALLAIQLALGALVSASHAAGSCTTFPDCHGFWWPADTPLAALDPRQIFEPLSGAAPGTEMRRQALHMLHRFGAVAVLGYWSVFAVIMRARSPAIAKASAVVTLMLIGEAVLGVAVVGTGTILAAVAHNAWAALTMLTAVRAAFQSRLAEEASVSAACQTVTAK
jgi:cytochrome c oxidase assembly protein subunit 15